MSPLEQGLHLSRLRSALLTLKPRPRRTPFATIVMHRRKDLWGPDALEFDPDRFLDERLHKYRTHLPSLPLAASHRRGTLAVTPNPFIFLPFNAGPRICLGQQVRTSPSTGIPATRSPFRTAQFAYHEASFFLVRLLQTFSGVTLDTVAQPPHARPPPEWKIPANDKSGWLAHEKVRPRSHLTMYVKVRRLEGETQKSWLTCGPNCRVACGCGCRRLRRGRLRCSRSEANFLGFFLFMLPVYVLCADHMYSDVVLLEF